MSFNPNQVRDSASHIRITDFQAYPMGQKAYVKIVTNMGVEGWGEINNMETKIACQLSVSLSEMIIGENPTKIEHHWQRLFRAHRNLRGGGLMVHCISAIDIALWDIAPVNCGKFLFIDYSVAHEGKRFGVTLAQRPLKSDRGVQSHLLVPQWKLLI